MNGDYVKSITAVDEGAAATVHALAVPRIGA